MINERVGKFYLILREKIQPFRWPLLILLLGVCLMLLPAERQATELPTQDSIEIDNQNLEIRLREVLAQIDGVGAVEVLLTVKCGPEYEYQTNDTKNKYTDQYEQRSETVVVSNGNGGEMPITINTVLPTYKGALIVCQGADRAAVRLAVVEAVSDLTGLSSEHISVIKMKGS